MTPPDAIFLIKSPSAKSLRFSNSLQHKGWGRKDSHQTCGFSLDGEKSIKEGRNTQSRKGDQDTCWEVDYSVKDAPRKKRDSIQIWRKKKSVTIASSRKRRPQIEMMCRQEENKTIKQVASACQIIHVSILKNNLMYYWCISYPSYTLLYCDTQLHQHLH